MQEEVVVIVAAVLVEEVDKLVTASILPNGSAEVTFHRWIEAWTIKEDNLILF